MSLVAIVALVICIVGLIGHVLSANAKLQAIFLYCFAVGLLAFLLLWGGHISAH
jgi:hypothetical protein